jgi:hypothetical protein
MDQEWNEEEVSLMSGVMAKGKWIPARFQHREIGACLTPRRSANDVRAKYRSIWWDSSVRWGSFHDDVLRRWVAERGANDWRELARIAFPTRTATSLRDRWEPFVRPRDEEQMSDEEARELVSEGLEQ